MDLLAITGLALVDSINPCTLAVQAILLSTLLLARGKRAAVIGGLTFAATIYVMYLLYGLGLLQAIYTAGIHNLILPVLVVLLIIMAAVEIRAYFRYRPGLVSMEMPTILRPIAKRYLSIATSPLTAIPVAALCSILLLPCSSGPYISAIMLLARKGVWSALPVLLYYNAVFVLPMVVVTLLVGVGLSPRRVQEWRERHIREMHLVSGLLLLAVLVLLLVSGPGAPTTTGGRLYLIYSPSCPHCHHLMEYLREMNVSAVLSTDISDVSDTLERAGYRWDGGVPLLVCKAERPVIMEGFPSASQDVNGYFLGRETEREICLQAGGRPVEENGTYLYCVMPSGALLGNANALRVVVAACQNK